MSEITSWHSYPSIYNLGSKYVEKLFSVPCNIEEKVDGSQFSFGLHPNTDTPVVTEIEGVPHGWKFKSKGAVMHPDAPMDMFKKGVEEVKKRLGSITPGWTYRAEYLAKPKHNSLAYDRVPKDHIIIFDINDGQDSFLDYETKEHEANRLGFEVVPRLGTLIPEDDHFKILRYILDNTTSILGGQKIEGVVVKPKDYSLAGPDQKALIGKFVSEHFKEVHRASWHLQEGNEPAKDILNQIGSAYTSPARWNKAIQHLRDAGKITDSLQDIGPIIKEIPEDVLKEEEEAIKALLFKWAWPHIKRMVTRGFPEYYKEKLLEKQFEKQDATLAYHLDEEKYLKDKDPGDEDGN